MPESKKLSELIEDFVWKTMEFNQYANFRNNVPQSILGKMTDKIDYLKNQIDQKFEELRCDDVEYSGRTNQIGIGEDLLQKLSEDKEKKKWDDIDEIIRVRITSEYNKYKETPENFWILAATHKIVSSLKYYENNPKKYQ